MRLDWLATEMAITTRQIGWVPRWPIGTRPLRPEWPLIIGVCAGRRFSPVDVHFSSFPSLTNLFFYSVGWVVVNFIPQSEEMEGPVIRPAWPTDRSGDAAGPARGKWTRWDWRQPEAHVASLTVCTHLLPVQEPRWPAGRPKEKCKSSNCLPLCTQKRQEEEELWMESADGRGASVLAAATWITSKTPPEVVTRQGPDRPELPPRRRLCRPANSKSWPDGTRPTHSTTWDFP